MLDSIFQQFNTREVSVIIWILVFIIWAFSQKKIRKSLIDVFKTLFHKKILSVVVSAVFYTGLIVFIFSKIEIWEMSLIKDTIYWFIGTAFVLLMNTNNANQEKGFFTKILKDNLKIIIVLELILALYTFNLWIEIILVPLLIFIVAMSAVAGTKKEYLPVKKLFDFVLSAIGIFFIVFALGKLFGDFHNLATSTNLKTFILPPLLTFAFVPFVYFFALIMSYETLFVRLKIFNKNNPDVIKLIKRKIVRHCHLNLPRLNSFAKESTQDLMKISSQDDVIRIMEKYFKK